MRAAGSRAPRPLWLVLILAAGARQALLARQRRPAPRPRASGQRPDRRPAPPGPTDRGAVSSVGDGIYGVDHEGRVTFINPSGARALGYEPHDLHGTQRPRPVPRPGRGLRSVPVEGRYVADAIREGMLATARRTSTSVPTGPRSPWRSRPARSSTRTGCKGAVVAFRDVTQRREVDR